MFHNWQIWQTNNSVVTEARTHVPGRSVLMFKSRVWRPLGYPTRGRGLESQCCILDGHFSHLFVVKNGIVCLKKTENKRKIGSRGLPICTKKTKFTQSSRLGAHFKNKFKCTVTTLCFNKELWLVVKSHMTNRNRSEGIISEYDIWSCGYGRGITMDSLWVQIPAPRFNMEIL